MLGGALMLGLLQLDFSYGSLCVLLRVFERTEESRRDITRTTNGPGREVELQNVSTLWPADLARGAEKQALLHCILLQNCFAWQHASFSLRRDIWCF